MSPDGFKTQVLLLHNDQSTLEKLESEFDLRYTVHFATSGSQALKAIAETPIDIFVSASDLPGMSGLEALREAKMRSPQTLGILLTDSTADEGAAAVGGEVIQIVRGQFTGEALCELVENASQQLRLPALPKSANDTTADAGGETEVIVMETADDGSSIISQSSVRLRALNPNSFVRTSPVDLLILTTDTEFLETIRASSGSTHKIHTATTLQEAEDIVRNRKVGVAVVDAAIVRDKIEHLTQYLRRASPRLVSVVAGRRGDGEMLIDLVNRGNVYRFLLKPVSSGRTRLAIEASVKHHLEAPDSVFVEKENTNPPRENAHETAVDAAADNEIVGEPGEGTCEPEARDNSAATESLSKTGAYRMAELAAAETRAARQTRRLPKKPVIAAIAGVLAVSALGIFFLPGRFEDNVASQIVAEPAATTTAAREADAAPGTPTVEQLINDSETALLDSRLQDADDALQLVATLDPSNARLPFLTAQVAQARLRVRLNDARMAIRENRFDDAADALSAAQSLTSVSSSTDFEALTAELESARSEQETDEVLALANASLESGTLLSPPNRNARYYYEQVLLNDPENAMAQQGLSIVASRVVLQARAEIDNGNFDVAKDLLDDARTLDPNSSELVSTATALQAARESEIAASEAGDGEPSVTDDATESAASEPGDGAPSVADNAAESAASEAPDGAPPVTDDATESVASEARDGAPSVADNAAESAASEARDGAPTVTDDATESVAVDTVEPAPAPVVEEKPTLEVVPAAVNSLVRTNYVAPKYPRNALRRNLSGWVDLEFTVSTDGTVKNVGAIASDPGDVFVDSATRAVEQWEFEPVLRDGVGVEKRVAVRMMFSLD